MQEFNSIAIVHKTHISGMDKSDFIDARLRSIQDACTRLTKDESGGIVLLAPEYFFNPLENSGKKKHIPISQEEKEKIEAKICALSAENPRVLIIPGSFLWEDTIREERNDVYFTKLNLIAKRNWDLNTRVEKAPLNSSTQSSWWSGVNTSAKGLKNSDVEDKINEEFDGNLEKLHSELKKQRKNTTFIYMDEKKIHEYDKVEEYESDFSKEAIFVNGKAPHFFKAHNTRFGIEICADHSLGCLVRFTKTYLFDAPSIHVLLSDGVRSSDDLKCCKNYFIHASGSLQECGVWKRDASRGNFDKLKGSCVNDVSSYKLDLLGN